MENIRNVYPVFRPLLDNTNDCIQLIDALKQSVKHPNIEKKYNVMNTQFFPKINCFGPLFIINNDIFIPNNIHLHITKMTYNIGDKYSIKYNPLEKKIVMK